MTSHTAPRIIFLDIDGTILDSFDRVADSTIEAVRAARANGHLVYLCTGRAPTEIADEIHAIGFDGAITAGGGFGAIGDRLVVSRTMPSDVVARMVDFYEASGYGFYMQTVDAVFPSPGVHERFERELATMRALRIGAPDGAGGETGGAEIDEQEQLEAFGDVRPMPTDGVAKSVFIGDDPQAIDRVVEALGHEMHVISGSMPHLGGASGEVSLAGVTKGSTITMLLDELGIDASTAIGIGDSRNDVEMFEVCGLGIAMDNASDAVKSHADEVTTSVDDDGVWRALQRHGLLG